MEPIFFLPQKAETFQLNLFFEEGEVKKSVYIHPMKFEKEIKFCDLPVVNKGLIEYNCKINFQPKLKK